MAGPEGEGLVIEPGAQRVEAVVQPGTGVDQSATGEAVAEPTDVHTIGTLTRAAAISTRTETPAKPKDGRSLMRGLSMGPQHFVPGRTVDNKPPAKVSPTLAEEMKRIANGGSGHGGYSGK